MSHVTHLRTERDYMKVRALSLATLVVYTALLLSCGGGGGNGGGSPTPPPKTLAVWSSSTSGIPFTMVGTDPSVAGAGTTNIAVEIIPVRLNFSAVGVVNTPENPVCGDTASPVERVVNSPMFTNNPWSDGNIFIGNTQFGDAFQRANLWSVVSNASPNYHVKLQPVTVLPTISVDVPPGPGATLSPSPTCPSQMIATISIDLMDAAVQQTLIAQNITPDTLPIFLTYDTMFLPEQFLGYHNVHGN